MADTPLDSILNDTEEAVETQEVETVTQVPETPEEPAVPSEGQERGPDGKFLPKQTGVEDAGPPPDKLPQEDYKAIREEREKRQRLEAELEALKQQFQQQPKAPPAPPPSIWEDEQGWQANLHQQIMQQADQLSRINASEMAARAQHADFQEMFDLFNRIAVENPTVVQQAMADPHPWNKAYQIAKNRRSMEELGAVDMADLEAKLREKIAAEMQQAAVPVQQPLSVPPSITGQRNVGARSGPAWSGPQALEDMLR